VRRLETTIDAEGSRGDATLPFPVIGDQSAIATIRCPRLIILDAFSFFNAPSIVFAHLSSAIIAAAPV
jgi:hypothetical protein